MEEFILGKGAKKQEIENEVRVNAGEAVQDLNRSMLEGTKVQKGNFE